LTSACGTSLDTCPLLDGPLPRKIPGPLAVVISEQERAGLDVLAHGDFHVDEDLAGPALASTIRCNAGPVSKAISSQPEETTAPWLHYPPGTLLNEIYTGWAAGPPVVDKIEHRPLDYPKLWRLAQGKTRKPIKFGTCCSPSYGSLPGHSHGLKYKDKRQIIGHGRSRMNKELLALRDAGCRCIQIDGATFPLLANTFGKDHDEVKFMVERHQNREVQGLDDVELWIHTCWGNPNMQRVMRRNRLRQLHRDLSRALPR